METELAKATAQPYSPSLIAGNNHRLADLPCFVPFDKISAISPRRT
jgi:hypothetical protein